MANQNQGHNQDGTQRSGTSNRGFASMDEDQQREIARLGGMAVSGNREHMAAIGRKGGEASAESRANERAASGSRTRSASADEPQGKRQGAPGRTAGEDGNRGRSDGQDLGRSLGGRSRADDDGTDRSNSH